MARKPKKIYRDDILFVGYRGIYSGLADEIVKRYNSYDAQRRMIQELGRALKNVLSDEVWGSFQIGQAVYEKFLRYEKRNKK